MDLVSNKTKCIVCMEHTSKGAHKVLEKCMIPLTGKRVVSTLITDFGVFEFRDGKMVLIEIAEGISLDKVKQNTSAKFEVASDVKKMQQ